MHPELVHGAGEGQGGVLLVRPEVATDDGYTYIYDGRVGEKLVVVCVYIK